MRKSDWITVSPQGSRYKNKNILGTLPPTYPAPKTNSSSHLKIGEIPTRKPDHLPTIFQPSIFRGYTSLFLVSGSWVTTPVPKLRSSQVTTWPPKHWKNNHQVPMMHPNLSIFWSFAGVLLFESVDSTSRVVMIHTLPKFRTSSFTPEKWANQKQRPDFRKPGSSSKTIHLSGVFTSRELVFQGPGGRHF